MTAEICPVCNRPTCFPAKLADVAHCNPWCVDVTQYGDEGIGRGFKPCAACLDCRANAIDWRERAIELRAELAALKAAQGWQVYGPECKPDVGVPCVLRNESGCLKCVTLDSDSDWNNVQRREIWTAHDGDLFMILPEVPK